MSKNKPGPKGKPVPKKKPTGNLLNIYRSFQ